MKKVKAFIGLLVIAVVAFFFVMSCVVRVPNGYVGVQYSVSGGVEDEVLTPRWYIIPPTKKVTLYSVATEQFNMSADPKEGGKEDESFDVVCKDGKMNVDVEMSYAFDADKVVDVFEKYRGLSGEEVMDTIIRGKIKTKINEVTSEYTVLDAYMEKKAELNSAITADMRDYLSEFGVCVESCNITRASVAPEIEAAITERSRVAQELEAEKMNQEKARLEAETALIKAQGQRDALLVTAQTEADVYRIKSEQISDKLLQKWLIDKWDGKLPYVSSSSDMMLGIGDLVSQP